MNTSPFREHRTHNVSQRSDPSLIATAYFCSPGTGLEFHSTDLQACLATLRRIIEVAPPHLKGLPVIMSRDRWPDTLDTHQTPGDHLR
jgi:hypothetical protein